MFDSVEAELDLVVPVPDEKVEMSYPKTSVTVLTWRTLLMMMARFFPRLAQVSVLADLSAWAEV